MTKGCTDCSYEYADECKIYTDGMCRRDKEDMSFEEANIIISKEGSNSEYELLNEEYLKIKLELEKYTYPDFNSIPESCRGCSNHPSNGGSGICHCILGLPKITC